MFCFTLSFFLHLVSSSATTAPSIIVVSFLEQKEITALKIDLSKNIFQKRISIKWRAVYLDMLIRTDNRVCSNVRKANNILLTRKSSRKIA